MQEAGVPELPWATLVRRSLSGVGGVALKHQLQLPKLEGNITDERDIVT